MRIENVQVLMGDGVFRKGTVEFEKTIQNIDVYETGDFGVGPYLIPGLIDIHTHGALGGDHCGGALGQTEKMAEFYAKNGTTSFLATTLTATEETLASAMRNIAQYKRAPSGARCLGVNLEGPFLSYEKRGAHPEDLLKDPDIALFERLYKLSGDRIKMVCIAPELTGAMDFIKTVSKVSRVSLAHSVADYKTAMLAFGNGATHVTHLFNAMNPFFHREPGLVGAAVVADAFVEVICDGNHLHPAIVRAVSKLFPQRGCLISDSLRCTGMPNGDYESAGLVITLKDGKATLKDSDILAGSAITLLQGVRIAVSLGIPLATAVTWASSHCAEALGLKGEIGTIAPGAKADLLLLDSQLNIQKVFIDGGLL